jgi:uncharacterized membrane protein YkoI
MQKKTMWITAAAIGAALVLGGAGVAVASSDIFDGDDDRVSTTTGTQNGGSRDGSSGSGRDDSDDRGRDDSDDRDAVTATPEQRSDAEAAAVAEAGGGTVREFDTGDSDDDYAYKVELVMDDGREVEVEFAQDLTVLRVDRN